MDGSKLHFSSYSMSRDGSDISKQEVNNDHVIFQFLFTSCWGICQYLGHP